VADTIRFLAEYQDGTIEPFDIPRCDLRSGDGYAPTIARERQTQPIGYPRLKPGTIVAVYRDPKIAYI
jgi:hypothetical protein